MDSLTDSNTLAQIQNLDPPSKLEIQQVIEEETRKAALQASTSSVPFSVQSTNIFRHP